MTGASPSRGPGLQPERTALAWRRTLLTLAGAALVALRLLPPVLGAPGVVIALAGFGAVAVLWVGSGRRLTQYQALLRGDQPSTLDGRWLLGITLVVTGGAAAAVLGIL